TGNADVTTSHDGILITRRGEGNDLIYMAIANNGQLPENVQPVIQRTPRNPVKQATPTSTPSSTPSSTPEAAPDKKKLGVSIESKPSGPLPDRVNPATSTTPGTPP